MGFASELLILYTSSQNVQNMDRTRFFVPVLNKCEFMAKYDEFKKDLTS